jgi:hypothetical protein
MAVYVMVPVPEGLADDVARFVQYTVAAADRPELDDEKVAIGVGSLDEPCLALLAHVVDSTLNARLATLPDLMAMLRCSEREVLGTIVEINQLMWIAGAPVALMPQKAPGAATTELKDQIVMVADAPARSVAAALRLDAAGHGGQPAGA